MATILIVDDHSDIRRLLTLSLNKAFDILEAPDGASAMDVIRHQHPDAVLLDIMMPGEIDGMQVLHAIKTDPKTSATLVVMISARGQTSDHEAASKLGADAYFVKPFSPLHVVKWLQDRLL
ncbi:MAG: response regulator [Comamonadaceae bacterium]